MNDFSLTQNLLNLALKNSNSRRIVRVNLLIGPFSKEREDSIIFYWRDLAKGSPGEGAELHFERVPFEIQCLECSGTFYLGENGKDSVCKYCHREHSQLLNGEDVRLENITVE